MLIDDLSRLPDTFKDGYRGLMLLHRNKDGNTGNAQRKSIKLISSSVDDWHKKIDELHALQRSACPNHRIYSSVNKRVLRKAIHDFKHRQLDVDLDSDELRGEFYTDIKNRFFSALMNPKCRETSYFLIDCDTELDHSNALRMISPELIVFDYETRNGRHLITNAFNPAILKWADLEPKKDDLIFIG